MTSRLQVDVAIVGGGIAGCAAAVALRHAGLTVAVLEKALCGAGASGVNFGGVRQQGGISPSCRSRGARARSGTGSTSGSARMSNSRPAAI
jgi:glycine/D-amino acid oxidase-like deaminating enzyme